MADVGPSFRIHSESPTDSSTASSPEPPADDDGDFFMCQANDSQSSLTGYTLKEMNMVSDEGRKWPVPPIDRLPPELLMNIFAKLQSPSDLNSCIRTCKKWAINCVEIMWHRPMCNTWPSLESVTNAVNKSDGFFAYYDLVKRLNLSALGKEVNDGTIQSFVNCKKIERLTLTNCAALNDAAVSALVTDNRHLQALDVSGLKSLSDHTLHTVAAFCRKLQGLNVTDCAKVTDGSVINISRSCPQLKRLKLNGCPEISDEAIMSLARNCAFILEIDLHGCVKIRDQAITALMTNLRQLRELRLGQCIQLSDHAFLDLPFGKMLDTLRILDLTACERIGDVAVMKIISAAPRLRNLILAKCKNITDRAVLAITKLGKNLHYIHLGHCTNITDDAVMQLIKLCYRIRYIDLACCHRLTDRSVKQLATLPKLRRIGLVKCTNITDTSIFALATARLSSNGETVLQSTLERVHLSYCVSLTIKGVHQLLNACPRLNHLSVTGVQAFLRDDLTAFCREAPPEFNLHQREMFCVYSGEGVCKLRDYLNEEIQTMYDTDDEAQDALVASMIHAAGINDDEEIDGESQDGGHES